MFVFMKYILNREGHRPPTSFNEEQFMSFQSGVLSALFNGNEEKAIAYVDSYAEQFRERFMKQLGGTPAAISALYLSGEKNEAITQTKELLLQEAPFSNDAEQSKAA